MHAGPSDLLNHSQSTHHDLTVAAIELTALWASHCRVSTLQANHRIEGPTRSNDLPLTNQVTVTRIRATQLYQMLSATRREYENQNDDARSGCVSCRHGGGFRAKPPYGHLEIECAKV